MGVKGLWSLLNPVARPVQIESMEGKRLAIDSSIWLYQFQSTMRDKEGRVLVNAHVLGFLRRINKLLFHGIKPVFVFDGGAPALKRSTIAERKRRKTGAAVNHAKMAEKLLAAQLRREAVRVAQDAAKARASRVAAAGSANYDDEESEQIPDNAVYLDQLEGLNGPPRPPRAPPPTANTSSATVTEKDETPEQRRKRFKKHDRYYLPEADVPMMSTDERPDPRLATEDELQQFIDDLHPEDVDVESPEFRALPTEVQYEIIGDLRVRSRQQSHKRLHDMLSAAPTALDFSKAQIKHLSQRNALTQQLLTVTDMVGKAHLTIPVRVAAERNREYVLVKRDEDNGGGWALGIREGTKEKPIVLEPESSTSKKEPVEESEDDYERDSDLESLVAVDDLEEAPKPVDEDLRQNRRQEILEAIAQRYAPAPAKKSRDVAIKRFGASRAAGAAPLFDVPDDDDISGDVIPSANDEALALALQQEELGSDEEVADPELARVLALSRKEAEGIDVDESVNGDAPGSDESDEFEEVALIPSGAVTPFTAPQTPEPIEICSDDSDDFEEIGFVPSRPKTPEPVAAQDVESESEEEEMVEVSQVMAPAPPKNKPDLLMALLQESAAASSSRPTPHSRTAESSIAAVESTTTRQKQAAASRPARIDPAEPTPGAPPREEPAAAPQKRQPLPVEPLPASDVPESPGASGGEDDLTMRFQRQAPSPSPPPPHVVDSPPPAREQVVHVDDEEDEEPTQLNEPRRRYQDDDDDDEPIEWSRSPSPVRQQPETADASAQSIHSGIHSEAEDDEEMDQADMMAEEDDYARFLAQIQNRDLNEVQTELDDEIRVLNQQTKAALRDSDEITQAMVVQIQTLLRHFGIPYITAPMEAEAQCAKLAELGLVDGIITDDSDVFLFGAVQCFKNIFNDAKFAECFLSSDVERELSLTRERLISLSYLLGSDYTIGLPGVGPVLALELLANFPGPNGLLQFKEWWLKVQRGQDLEIEADTKWKRAFKKRFSGSIFLTAEWPNPHVREAYLYPTADESDEPFHWGFPRLASLRTFLHEELSWSISKVDDELTPIVQRIAKRGRGGIPSQTTLLPFFDNSAGAGVSYSPRRRTTANISKRLMSVIKEFREAEAKAQGQQPQGWGEMLAGIDESDPKGKGTGKKRSTTNVTDAADADTDTSKKAPKRQRKSRASAASSAPSVSEKDSDGEVPAPRPKRARKAKGTS